MASEQANQRALTLLAVGAVVGVLLGVATAFQTSDPDVRTFPDDAIALVNGRPISEEEYARAVALLASDKRTGVTDEDRAHVLNRLLEEELLVQRGIEVGLVDSDRTVRKAITQAMLASVVAESASAQPTDEVLRAFYAENPSLFAHPVPAGAVQGTVEEEAGAPPALDEVREQVEAAYLRRSRDEALREYVEWLRSEAKITLAPEARQ
jgi:hypothetical protein